MEYEERIALSLDEHLDFRPATEIADESDVESAEIWPTDEKARDIYRNFRVANRLKDRKEAVVKARGAVNAVFDDPEALETLLHALYLSVHAADPDHDVHEHAQEFTGRVLHDLHRPFVQRGAPGHASEPHVWPCAFFWSQNWTGGGHSGKPLARREGKTCTCWVDLGPEDL